MFLGFADSSWQVAQAVIGTLVRSSLAYRPSMFDEEGVICLHQARAKQSTIVHVVAAPIVSLVGQSIGLARFVSLQSWRPDLQGA